MIDEQRKLYRKSTTQLQIDVKKMSEDHLQQESDRMREICSAKDKGLCNIKAELRRRVSIEHTLLSSKHTVLNLKVSQGGAEGYSQLQKDFKDPQAKYKVKKEECMVFEQQCNFLSEAFQEQSMVLPSKAPTNAPAPAPSATASILDLPEGWELSLLLNHVLVRS
jgi:hypothetical protein